jgi:RND superfamily putative drug exporter
LAVVFFAFATAKVSLIKTFGVGLALAILVDAFIIRATLVPALMRIAGRANWWSPRRLRRLHLRIGIWEPEPIDLLDSPEIARLKELAAKAPTRKPKAKARPKSTSKAKAKPKTKPKARPRR